MVDTWLRGSRPALLEIEGEAGIGKTTLWDEAVRAARQDGALVLDCRPVEIETAISYGALAGLLEPALDAIGPGTVPAPRLRAVEGALRLRDVHGSSLDETAVALGTLSVLRSLARQQPVVLALDDVQWLDASSRLALTFALRNVGPDDDVAVVLTRRVGPESATLDLAGSCLHDTAETLRPGALSVGAVHRMVTMRLGRPLSRPKLVRVHTASRGNPLHALELARVVADAGPDDPLIVPDSLAETLRARLTELSPTARRLLLVVTAAGEPRLELLPLLARRPTIAEELDESVAHGVLVVVGDRVRFAHPLLGSTVYADAGELQRRDIHLRLAELAETTEERARHLALSGHLPDEAVASSVEHAALSACERGARSAGAALYEQAGQLTPRADVLGRERRLIAAAQAHFQAGEPDRARALLESIARGQGPLRYVALCRLGLVLDETVGGASSFEAFESALESDDAAVVSQAHRGLAQTLAYVGDLDRALGHADAAVRAAEALPDRGGLAYALSAQALARKIAAHPEWQEPLERGLRLESEIELHELDSSPSAFDADTRRIALDLDGSRTAYERVLGLALERGDVRTEAWCRFGLAWLEIAAGRWSEAAEHAGELIDLSEQTGLLRLPTLRTVATLTLLRGDAERARSLIADIVADAEQTGELLNLRASLQLDGFLALSLGDAGSAVAPLRRAREIAEQMSIGEPGMLTFLLDEVEALAATDDHDGAAAVLQLFEERVTASPSAWTSPLVLRGRGLVCAARRDLDGACAVLHDAVGEEAALPLPLERARTRLALGRVLRRLQRRSEAQAALEHALATFEQLGAPLWADRAREEIRRIGGRTGSGDELTATERRIADLAAEGRTNREIAAALFVTPKTVESTLTRIYRKLGVRSRTELARRLTDGE